MHVRRALLTALTGVLLATTARAQAAPGLPTITDYTKAFDKRDGYFPLYWDGAKARLFLEIPRLGEEFLYLPSLATGLGAADLPFDRGTIGSEQLARFDRVGPRALLIFANPQFRALSDNASLRRSVDESFPTSTMAAFDIVAEEGGRLLVDATGFFTSDVMNVRGDLRDGNQGGFALDKDRSTIYLPHTKAFPNNTEIEAALTFTSDNPGPLVRQHAPDGRALTLRTHHSLVKLPDAGFRPRLNDPRMGFFAVSFLDFAKPLDRELPTQFAVRHRLQKKDPGAALSDPVRPIVYYLDPGIPEPYHSAFRDGAMWWNRVFEAAGFRNAFRVEDLPADADPMDARYNVIQWVHRSAAGYSIGPTFVDPRTGEIIKAAVRMESHRSFSDYDIFGGALPTLAGAGGGGEDWEADGMADLTLSAWIAALDPAGDATAFAMARRRQHTAHEVGHTLGLAHNFATSSYGRASVMDYPGPLIRLVNGHIDVSDAYRDGPGAWDTLAIRWGYTEFPADQEARNLDAIARDGLTRGLRYITNPDEGNAGSFPEASLWDNGSDEVAELARVEAVRDTLLRHFDERAIAPGDPMALLNRRFATVYLHHRFTLDAGIKAIGGMAFRYGLRGDSLPVTAMIDPARQRRALELALDALRPDELAVPEPVLAILAPRPPGFTTGDRAFASAAAPAFDQLGIARTLAASVIGDILAPQRAARLVSFAARDPNAPSLTEVIGRIIQRTWGAPTPVRNAALQRVVQRTVVDELINLAGNERATPDARAAAEWGLRRVARIAGAPATAQSPDAEAHRALAAADIARFLDRRDAATTRHRPATPPVGVPIGKP